MNILQHPQEILDQNTIEHIRSQAPKAANNRKLTQEQLKLIYKEWL